MKFRYCVRCMKRTAHHDRDGTLRCSQCVHEHPEPTKEGTGKTTSGGLRAALALCVTYPHAAQCFFVQTIKVCLKICVLIWLLAGVIEHGFFTSVFMGVIAFFAIDCFGPRGKEKAMATEFGKQFWTTLVPR